MQVGRTFRRRIFGCVDAALALRLSLMVIVIGYVNNQSALMLASLMILAYLKISA